MGCGVRRMHGLAAIFSGVPGAGDLAGGNKHVGGQDEGGVSETVEGKIMVVGFFGMCRGNLAAAVLSFPHARQARAEAKWCNAPRRWCCCWEVDERGCRCRGNGVA